MRNALLAACALLTGCYAGLNADPGQYVIDAGGLGSHNNVFTQIVVIAPEGGRSCRLVDTPLGERGPQANGRTNDVREVTLAISTEIEEIEISCTTSRGRVVRRIEEVALPVRVNDRQEMLGRFPPMIHIGVPDAQARARWDALQARICSPGAAIDARGRTYERSEQFICEAGRFERLRAADIGES